MKCANPQCATSPRALTGGTLWCLEMEASPEERTLRSDGGFPTCSVPTRFFWLCRRCSEQLVIKRWTAGGLVFGAIPAAPMAGRRLGPFSEEPRTHESASDVPKGFLRRA